MEKHDSAHQLASSRDSLTKEAFSEDPSVLSTPARSTPSCSSGDVNSFNLYLREISTVKLLTLEEEVELGRRIQQGDQQARDRMIEANLRLVVKVARDYEGLGVPLMDLISEGNIGLMKAVDRFDPAKGAKLSTYACFWIKQSIKRALANQSKTIRIPVHMVEKISKMNQANRTLAESLGHEPSDEELAGELGITFSRVQAMRSACNRMLSLDVPIGEEEGTTLAEIVADERLELPIKMMAGRGAVQMMREMLGNLTSREAVILNSRFGLDGSRPQQLEEVGKKLGITRERVRQIQNRALGKLRRQMERCGVAQSESMEGLEGLAA